jgi:hypothetical protein
VPDDAGGGVRLWPVEVRAAGNRKAHLRVGVSRQDSPVQPHPQFNDRQFIGVVRNYSPQS